MEACFLEIRPLENGNSTSRAAENVLSTGPYIVYILLKHSVSFNEKNVAQFTNQTIWGKEIKKYPSTTNV